MLFNVAVQLAVGIPLEIVHGWLRVALIYCSGVIAGAHQRHTVTRFELNHFM